MTSIITLHKRWQNIDVFITKMPAQEKGVRPNMTIAVKEHSAILSTFIKLPFVLKTYVLSIFEWPLRQVLLYLWHMRPVPTHRGYPMEKQNGLV